MTALAAAKGDETNDAKILVTLDEQFGVVYRNSCALVETVPAVHLYERRSAPDGRSLPSCAESVLRTAAIVEQTFGGITASLWDDPFEWTLIETLSTPQLILAYLSEVEATRQRAFGGIKNDDALRREIAVLSGEMKTLFALLMETLVRAAHQQGEAFANARLFVAVPILRRV